MIDDFGLTFGTDIIVHDAATVLGRNKRAGFASVYFGGAEQMDHDAGREVIRSSAPVIPTAAPAEAFNTQIPDGLQVASGLRRRDDNPAMANPTAGLLECVGLLRRQRGVFVSYWRIEARAAAVQLHDFITGRKSDVFLEKYDIKHGDPFQDVLWHRLVGCDVKVMLDTPIYVDQQAV